MAVSTVTVAVEHPERFINRELSWLDFNQRVLEEARDPANPLLERVKYLAIVSSNLDEFFEIRVAGLKQQRQSGIAEVGPDGMSPGEQLDAISQRVRRLVREQYACWNKELVPALENQSIRFFGYPDLPSRHRKYLAEYFKESVYPVLTPLAIDPGHPFPQLLNKSLNVLVELAGDGLTTDLAVVQVPRILPRVVALPRKSFPHDFIFIGNVIEEHVGSLFHGVKVKGVHQFRVTRNSNLYFDEEEADNLLRAIESELRKMNRGKGVRLEVQHDCPRPLANRLLEIFNLDKDDLYLVDGPVNLLRLLPVVSQIDRPDLKFKPHVPALAVRCAEDESLFDRIRQADILLHHPYDSFKTVLDFILQAVADEEVLAIKQTLYRTGGDSPIVPALAEAAQGGKQVTVIIELKARFDEAANIKWARLLQEAGVNVVYGLVGLKTHSKAALVVRREGGRIRRYAHIGTGNYHPSTARLYTDLGILTCNDELCVDVAELFNQLTGVSKFPGMKRLLAAPFNLHERMLEMVGREIGNAKAGRPCGISAKMNSLVDEGMINALYLASQAGVPVRLLVRGTCCLRPGVPGVSEGIEVRSIVGRFLEHSRIFRFENGGEPEMFIGSADWMPRNFFRRIEAVTPILDPALRDQVGMILDLHWRDNVKARQLRSEGDYRRVPRRGEPFNVQERLIELARQTPSVE